MFLFIIFKNLNQHFHNRYVSSSIFSWLKCLLLLLVFLSAQGLKLILGHLDLRKRNILLNFLISTLGDLWPKIKAEGRRLILQ